MRKEFSWMWRRRPLESFQKVNIVWTMDHMDSKSYVFFKWERTDIPFRIPTRRLSDGSAQNPAEHCLLGTKQQTDTN